MKLFYISRSNNIKTGDIPQQYIGESPEVAKSTCQGCPMLKGTKRQPNSKRKNIRLFGLRCYSHYGHSGVAHRQIIKRAAKYPQEYTLRYALQFCSYSARYVRFAANADPSGIPQTTFKRHYNLVRQAGKGVLCYTHFPIRAPWLKRYSLASADTWPQAEKYTKLGWRVAVHTSADIKATGTYHGFKWIHCPQERGKTTCNDCGLCDAQKPSKYAIIVFTDK